MSSLKVQSSKVSTLEIFGSVQSAVRQFGRVATFPIELV